MKTKMFLLSALLISTISLTANSSGKGEHIHDNDQRKMQAADYSVATTSKANVTLTDPAFQKQLSEVFTSYINLKDAFVASDASKVKVAAGETQKKLDAVDMKLVVGEQHNDWMKYLDVMDKSLKEIQASTDIEAQRKMFSELSDALYKSIKAFGIGGIKAYYEFCPMALDNGAYWLSSEEKIRNPYFGDKMLTCGSVKEKL